MLLLLCASELQTLLCVTCVFVEKAAWQGCMPSSGCHNDCHLAISLMCRNQRVSWATPASMCQPW